jgi:hypothetical protein
MHDSQIPGVPAIASAKFPWRMLQHQDGRPSFSCRDGRAQSGVPATDNQDVVNLIQVRHAVRRFKNINSMYKGFDRG